MCAMASPSGYQFRFDEKRLILLAKHERMFDFSGTDLDSLRNHPRFHALINYRGFRSCHGQTESTAI